MNHVVAEAGLDVVVAAGVDDDVVAVAAVDDVVAEAAIHAVVAGIAEEGVVANARGQDVIRIGTAKDDMLVAVVAQSYSGPAVPDITSCVRMPEPTGSQTVEDAIAVQVVELPGLVDLEDQSGVREHVRRQMRRVGVAHDHRGEGVVLHLAEQVQTVEPLQVVEAVAALQFLHLDLEDEVERRAQHAAERHGFLGKAADPEIDILEPAEAARNPPA